MQHAESVERLADLALEPGRLARLESDGSPEMVALRSHLASCDRCATELAGWRRTWAQIGLARSAPGESGDVARAVPGASGSPENGAEFLPAPESLRSATRAAIDAERDSPAQGQSGPSIRRPADPAPRAAARRPSAPWLGVAAALVVALGAGTLALNRSAELDRVRAENVALASTTATLDRVLATPIHWVVTLRAPDATAGGTVAWTTSEIAVITTAVPPPAKGQSYRCWVERDGVRTPVGPMSFSGSTGYWAGPMDGWGDLLSPGAQFGVSLMSEDGRATPVLTGSL